MFSHWESFWWLSFIVSQLYNKEVIHLSNYINLILDTTGVANPSIILDGGAANATTQLVTATIGTTDTPTTGYQMLLWGDVDNSYNANIQSTMGASLWIAYSTSQQVKLSTVDAVKTIFLKIRDDVYNESSQTSDTINLVTTLATVTVSSPDLPKISKIAGKNVASFTFSSDIPFTQYKVKVVPSISSIDTAGVTILQTNGSTNMTGSGSFAASTPISCTINGSDLEVASTGDSQKIIKVFVQDAAGWSL